MFDDWDGEEGANACADDIGVVDVCAAIGDDDDVDSCRI